MITSQKNCLISSLKRSRTEDVPEVPFITDLPISTSTSASFLETIIRRNESWEGGVQEQEFLSEFLLRSEQPSQSEQLRDLRSRSVRLLLKKWKSLFSARNSEEEKMVLMMCNTALPYFVAFDSWLYESNSHLYIPIFGHVNDLLDSLGSNFKEKVEKEDLVKADSSTILKFVEQTLGHHLKFVTSWIRSAIVNDSRPNDPLSPPKLKRRKINTSDLRKFDKDELSRIRMTQQGPPKEFHYFSEVPFELQFHIFTFVSNQEWQSCILVSKTVSSIFLHTRTFLEFPISLFPDRFNSLMIDCPNLKSVSFKVKNQQPNHKRETSPEVDPRRTNGWGYSDYHHKTFAIRRHHIRRISEKLQSFGVGSRCVLGEEADVVPTICHLTCLNSLDLEGLQIDLFVLTLLLLYTKNIFSNHVEMIIDERSPTTRPSRLENLEEIGRKAVRGKGRQWKRLSLKNLSVKSASMINLLITCDLRELVSLDLTGMCIQNDHLETFFRVKELPNLQELSLGSSSINPKLMELICSLPFAKNLKIFRVPFCGLKDSSESSQLLIIKLIHQNMKNLEILDLSYNFQMQIYPSTIILFSEMTNPLSRLKQLYLKGWPLLPQHLHFLMSSLSSSSLELLDVRFCNALQQSDFKLPSSSFPRVLISNIKPENFLQEQIQDVVQVCKRITLASLSQMLSPLASFGKLLKLSLPQIFNKFSVLSLSSSIYNYLHQQNEKVFIVDIGDDVHYHQRSFSWTDLARSLQEAEDNGANFQNPHEYFEM